MATKRDEDVRRRDGRNSGRTGNDDVLREGGREGEGEREISGGVPVR